MALTEDRISGVDTEPAGATPMRVRKRNGDLEPVDVNKIVKAAGDRQELVHTLLKDSKNAPAWMKFTPSS